MVDEFDTAAKLTEVPESLKPAYSMDAVNSPISLYAGDIEFDNAPGKFHGELEMKWLPSPSLILSISPGYEAGFFGTNEWSTNIQLRTSGLGGVGEALPLALGSEGSRLLCTRLAKAVSLPVDYVTFEIVNGYRMLGSGIRIGGSVRAGRTVLETEGWRITLDEVSDSETFRTLSESRGYALTHTGRLDRIGSQISIEEARPLLNRLAWLLSFARGAFSGPVLVSGWSNDQMLSFHWGQHRVDAWATRDTWYPDHTRGVLEALFPKWNSLFEREPWDRSLPLAIDLYLRANVVGELETSLLLSHAALELLAWTVLVEDSMSYTPEKFDQQRFSDRLRLLLEWATIPSPIPDECKALGAWVQDDVDGPHALSILRNGVVHPSKRERVYGAPVAVRVDAAQLGVRYLELVLLRLQSYEGRVQNRLDQGRWRGETVPVPWSNP